MGEAGRAERLARMAPLEPRSLNVLLDVTNQCNLKCRMCYFSFPEVWGRPMVQISLAEFEHVADTLFPFAHTVILSAGCEPLVHDDFAGLLAIAARHRLPALKFLTNAQLLTPELSRAAIVCGVTEIHVSIDGATRQTYEWVRRGARFETLVKNLQAMDALKRELGSATPVMQFNVTLMRCNVEQLGEFARLGKRLGVKQLSCRHLMPYEGLGMEDQCLVRDRAWANQQLVRGLEQVARAGMAVVMFPELFGEGDTSEPPWVGVSGAEHVLSHVGFESRAAASFGSRQSIRMPPPAGAAGADAAAVARTDAGANGDAIRRPVWRRLAAMLRRGLRSPPWNADLVPGPEASRLPFGQLDQPIDEHVALAGDLVLSGWALHRLGVEAIVVCRRPRGRERLWRRGAWHLVELARARLRHAARPDVCARFPHLPDSLGSGWTCRLDTRELFTDEGELELLVMAQGRDGRRAVIGRRWVSPGESGPDLQALYCARPFRSIYLDAQANVYPYPDCQTVEPFGRLLPGTSLSTIWYGEAFTELRRRILELDPPAMCRGCPDFVNAHPDDPDYYVPRRLKANFRLPQGAVDDPPLGVELDLEVIHVHGWAAGFSPVTRVWILREPVAGDEDEPRTDDGLVPWTSAWLGLPRPDLEAGHARLPEVRNAGWGAGLLTWMLPPDLEQLVLHVRVENADGASVELGLLRFRLWTDDRRKALRES